MCATLRVVGSFNFLESPHSPEVTCLDAVFHEQLTAADGHHSHRARYLDIKGLVVGAILSTILVWHLLVLTLENVFAVHVLEIDQQLLAALLVIVLLHESSAFGFCGRGGILSRRQATS